MKVFAGIALFIASAFATGTALGCEYDRDDRNYQQKTCETVVVDAENLLDIQRALRGKCRPAASTFAKIKSTKDVGNGITVVKYSCWTKRDR